MYAAAASALATSMGTLLNLLIGSHERDRHEFGYFKK
jgi:hypothetical protein